MRFEYGQIVAFDKIPGWFVVTGVDVLMGLVELERDNGQRWRMFSRFFEIQGATKLLSHWVQFEGLRDGEFLGV